MKNEQECAVVVGSLDLVLPIEWPFPPLVLIPLEERPRVAMYIAQAFREEARRWENQAFQIAAEVAALQPPAPHAAAIDMHETRRESSRRL